VSRSNPKLEQIKAVLRIGETKKRPKDWFDGEITVNGATVSKARGTYMGFLDIGGVRYWDQRQENDCF